MFVVMRAVGIPLLLTLYAFWPGDPDGLLSGPPWRLGGAAVITLALLGALLRSVGQERRPHEKALGLVLLIALAGRVALSPMVLPRGWSSQFKVDYGSELLSVERIGRKADNGGTVDRQLVLTDRSSVLQFFNDQRFLAGGTNRTVAIPWQGNWRGFLLLEGQETVEMNITGNGFASKELRLAIRDVKRRMRDERWADWRAHIEALKKVDQERLASGNRGYLIREGTPTLGSGTTLRVHVLQPQSQYVWLDGSPLVDGVNTTRSALPKAVSLGAGIHEVTVQYRKGAGESPLFAFALRRPWGRPLTVYANRPEATRLRADRSARLGLRVLDLLVLCLSLWWLGGAGRVAWRLVKQPAGMPIAENRFIQQVMQTMLLLVFSFQGAVLAQARSSLTVFNAGDDMCRYAALGRDIALHGLLMNQGQPLGSGVPFFFYPLYPYFVAATHRLFDESFFGLVFLQFILLGITVALVTQLARDLFGQRVGWVSLAVLVVLAEVNFSRWYTVSVFSDNLYYPLVAAAVLATSRLLDERRPDRAMVAGMLCGAATLTRPSMVTFLPFAAVWLFVARTSGISSGRRASRVLRFGMGWLTTVGLATIRNALVSGRFVPLVESFGQVLVFLAPPGVHTNFYETGLGGRPPSFLEVARGALRMMQDYPAGTSLVMLRKLLFIFGFTNLAGYAFHPEFVLLSSGYALWWVVARKNTPKVVLLHLFLLSHLLAMLIASPSTYGYKTLLTNMMLLIPFAADAAIKVVQGHRAPVRVRSALVEGRVQVNR